MLLPTGRLGGAARVLALWLLMPALLWAGHGHEADPSAPVFPLPVGEYHDPTEGGVWAVLWQRVEQEPVNLFATVIFALAILHTFLVGPIRRAAERAHHREEAYRLDHFVKEWSSRYDWLRFKASMLEVLGEVEAVFLIWAVPLILGIIWMKGFGAMESYVNGGVEYTEPAFVMIIMIIASSKPIVRLSESLLSRLARLGGGTPLAWWMSILTVGPVLGSFITEPAAMTICAFLLARRLYDLAPSRQLAYGSVGLLFVNISISGTLTNFAAPPVLMVAGRWEWSSWHLFGHFGWKAVVAVLISNLVYLAWFNREFFRLTERARQQQRGQTLAKEARIPVWVTGAHLAFLGWTVFNAHSQPILLGTGLLFLVSHGATRRYQFDLKLIPPLMVGAFLAGLVIHGGLQAWWIQPVLGSLEPLSLMGIATLLTAFNDNALITFLSTLVPNFAEPMKLAVVAGAVTGGGLTVIANAPNPAGQSILKQYFGGALQPLWLLAAALVPTLVAGLCFLLLPSF